MLLGQNQNKDHLKKFMESVLKNVTKMKMLKRDITGNYTAASGDQPGA